MTVLFIALGGAIGSVGRYLVSVLVLRATTPFFPYGTFLVNVSGSFAFGVIAGLAQSRLTLSNDARAFLLVGVLGGFTTFSTFAFDGLTLLRDGQSTLALVNLLGQVVLGVVAAWLGLKLAQ